MGTFTVTRWRCDRCKCDFPEKPPRQFDYSVTLLATENGVWAGGTVIEWKELCHPCNHIVAKAIQNLKEDASQNALAGGGR